MAHRPEKASHGSVARVGSARDQSRPLTLGRAEVNLFNASTAVLVNDTYGVTGAAWLQPQQLFQGRYAKLGVQVTF